MSAIIVLVLRILMAVCLFSFLGWALYTIWTDLRTQAGLLQTRRIPPLTLVVTNTLEDQRQTFNLPEILIGRSPTCNYTIQNETVSSNHARLSFHHDQWWAEDLRSTNGTFLNEERVNTPTVMINGDELRCGQVVIRLTIEPLS